MSWLTALWEGLVAAFKSIPYLDKWFSKPEIDKELADRTQVDKEQDENAVHGRPSNEFWKKRHL